jgi:hypothetical protein
LAGLPVFGLCGGSSGRSRSHRASVSSCRLGGAFGLMSQVSQLIRVCGWAPRHGSVRAVVLRTGDARVCSRWDVPWYASADALPSKGIRPYFIAPVRRSRVCVAPGRRSCGRAGVRRGQRSMPVAKLSCQCIDEAGITWRRSLTATRPVLPIPTKLQAGQGLQRASLPLPRSTHG